MRLGFVLLLLTSSAAAAEPSPSGGLRPHRSPAVTSYADLQLRWNAGAIEVEQVTLGRFPAPTRLTRYRGRFEAQVLARGRRVDALSFDFPLLGEADAGLQERLADVIRSHLTSATTVRVPLPEGADMLQIVDTRVADSTRVFVPIGSFSRPEAKAPALDTTRPDRKPAAPPPPAAEAARTGR